MAKSHSNTKSSSFLKDKDAFLKDLKSFNESKNITCKPPIVNGIEIDLFHLYSLVQQRGGLGKVNQYDTWESFLRPLRLPHPCVNGSTLLRRLYGTYLEKYERAKGPPGRDDDMDMDEDPRRSRAGGMPRISFGGGIYISASGETLRTGTRVAGPSERLALSLLSPMPNEQDFAVNVCTVLAADHSNRLPLAATPHILDFLLAHAGVYNHSSLRDTIGRSYFEARGMYPDEFWEMRAGGGGARELADETKFMQPGLEQPELMVTALAAHNTLTDCLFLGDEEEQLRDKVYHDMNMPSPQDVLEDWVTEPSEESQLFAPELPGGASCVYTQRVLQIASIVRSLSFHEENVQYLAKNQTLIRFLLLCANCWVGSLRQSGLDTLGNVSMELIIKDPATCLISRHVLSTIQSALVSPDRARVLAALELLNKLAQNEVNEDALLKALEAKVRQLPSLILWYFSYKLALVSLNIARVLVALELLNKLAQNEVNEDALLKALEAKVRQLPSLILWYFSYKLALVSLNIARVLAALELLNKLSQNEVNEDALLKALEAKVYSDVCSLLTLRDIMVLVCTLECVYALTSLGDRASEAVARVPGLVHTLVSLVTVEAQSYGPRACILMRVVETVSGPSALAAVAERDAANQSANTQQQTPVQQKPPEPTPPPVQVSAPAPAPSPAPAPAPALAPAAGTAPVNTLQQSHIQQRTVQENEHFAQAWLRSSFEPLPPTDNSAFDAAELYRQYLACCSKLSRKGVIAPAHFPRLVRTIFGGTVGPNNVTTSTGETQQVYVGIRSRNVANRPNQTAGGPSSPILKAQLTNKPGPDVKPVTSQAQTSGQPVHPHLSQALESNPSNTTLIKHLLAHKVAQRQQSQQRAMPATNTVVVQQNQVMEVDPEALIKCSTITPGGVASSTPATEKVIISAPEEALIIKEEPVQIQIDEQAQLTIKTAQNKMLADLLEKKSNPPVQVVQMGQTINAPTIQITETGQIVQVKADSEPVIQINPEANQYFQIKNEQGQLIQIKNDQGQLIQLKTENPVLQHGQIIMKSDQINVQSGHLIQHAVMQAMKTEKDQIIDTVITDHSYTEPPVKRPKFEEKREASSPQESVSKTAANLYAALAASALEDEDFLPPKSEPVETLPQPMLVSGAGEASVIIQEPILQVQQPTMQVQQPTLQVQQPTLQVQQPTLQVQQPMLQVQPMDVQNILASQSGQIILQEKTMSSQPTQYVQQPMQIIATPSSSQGGLSYITQNLPGNMMQKTIIIVQGPTGGGPLTLTVNNPGGLDEATLNSLIAQATEAITQQQIIQNSGVIQSTQRVIVSQPTLVSTAQPITVVKTAIAQNAPQLTASQQPIITSQPQPHKAQIVNQPQTQQIVVTQKQPPTLISTSSGNQIVSNQQIIQGSQHILQGNQQIIAVSNNQQIIVNAPLKPGVHRMMQQPRSQIVTNVQPTIISQTSTIHSEVKPTVIQANAKSQQPVMRQVITRQPVMVGNTKIGEKEMIVTQPVPVTEPPKPPTPKLSATPPPQLSQPQPTQPPPTQTSTQEDTPWICHWRGCGKIFPNASEVFSHAARVHCPPNSAGEAPCMWIDCDRVPRRTFALLNHLTDKHCTPHALKAIYNARRHQAAEADSNKPVSLGYPPNAALAALNKHAADMFNPRDLMDENEGPVTKSIRLTAALILRNIVIYSNTGRRQLRSYEAHLASIALSSVEASRTIAQVLYDMNNI